MFSKVVVLFYIPKWNVGELQLFHIFDNMVYCPCFFKL